MAGRRVFGLPLKTGKSHRRSGSESASQSRSAPLPVFQPLAIPDVDPDSDNQKLHDSKFIIRYLQIIWINVYAVALANGFSITYWR
jgi:hypothetical protein